LVQRFGQTLNRHKTRGRIMKIAAVYQDSEISGPSERATPCGVTTMTTTAW
jgi:hypothetical protein